MVLARGAATLATFVAAAFATFVAAATLPATTSSHAAAIAAIAPSNVAPAWSRRLCLVLVLLRATSVRAPACICSKCGETTSGFSSGACGPAASDCSASATPPGYNGAGACYTDCSATCDCATGTCTLPPSPPPPLAPPSPPPSPPSAPAITDVFSSSWTTECSGSSAAWAEVCGESTVVFTADQGFASAVVLANIARLGQSVVDETIDLRLKIRQVAHPHDTTYVGFSSVRCRETTACAAPMLHGVVSNLTPGKHTATLEYKTNSATAYFRFG